MLQNIDDGCSLRSDNEDVDGKMRDLDELRRRLEIKKSLILEKETQLRQEYESVRVYGNFSQ